MREQAAWLRLAAVAAFVACTGSERSRRPWDELLPRIIVAITPRAESLIVRDTVRALPAPEIRFPALTESDPNHVLVVKAPGTGLVVRIEQRGSVAKGDTLAVIGQGSVAAGRLLAVLADRRGTWQARREMRQLIWQDDTLGLLEEQTYRLAVGSVGDYEARFIHPGDPALVELGEDPPKREPGRVEWVRRPGPQHPFSSEVAVDFRVPEGPYRRGGPVNVTVRPTDPEDSIAAVPAAAVVQLPIGTAVFIRLAPALYEVRWVVGGPAERGMIPLREGVKPGTLVVLQGLAALVSAARDSLDRATRGQPR